MNMNTKISFDKTPPKEYCTIDELEQGDFFIFDGSDICIKTENNYKELGDYVWSNAISVKNGEARIFSGQHKLKLIKSINIDYSL